MALTGRRCECKKSPSALSRRPPMDGNGPGTPARGARVAFQQPSLINAAPSRTLSRVAPRSPSRGVAPVMSTLVLKERPEDESSISDLSKDLEAPPEPSHRAGAYAHSPVAHTTGSRSASRRTFARGAPRALPGRLIALTPAWPGPHRRSVRRSKSGLRRSRRVLRQRQPLS